MKIFKWFKHKCEYDLKQVSGYGKESKFYIERICRVCGKVQHKDLRYSTSGVWVDGSYIKDEPKDELSQDIHVIENDFRGYHRIRKNR